MQIYPIILISADVFIAVTFRNRGKSQYYEYHDKFSQNRKYALVSK